MALASCRNLPEPDPDEALLVSALVSAGIDAQVFAWDDPKAPFAAAALTVLRSTWNYIHNLGAFLLWAESIGSRLQNSPSVVRWNSHKGYLFDLAACGIAIVPTVMLPCGSSASLAHVMDARGWTDGVVKPAVGAGSFATRRIHREAVGAETFECAQDMLLQPYVRSVEGEGERAIVMIDGHITHAVRKSPRFAGEIESVSDAMPISLDERQFAEAVFAAGQQHSGNVPLLYGRADIARDDNGQLLLMELELIEPSLFLLQSPLALGRFVEAIRMRANPCPGVLR